MRALFLGGMSKELRLGEISKSIDILYRMHEDLFECCSKFLIATFQLFCFKNCSRSAITSRK